MQKVLPFLEPLIYYSTVLFLPTQLGRHFWPSFSTVAGIRVDYLSPTIYLTDLLILFLFIFFVISKIKESGIKNKKRQKFSIFNFQFSKKFQIANLKKLNYILFLGFFLSLFIKIVISRSPLLGFYGLLKLLEFGFFGFYTAKHIRSKKEIFSIASFFAAGVFFESILAIAQFIYQRSLGGIFYFFGERSFNGETPGIANASIYGQLVLRPYATFPHPNVLAGYLTITLAMVIYNFKFTISNFKRTIFLSIIVAGTIALFLTMSRVAIILWLIILFFRVRSYINTRVKKNKLFIYYSLFIVMMIMGFFSFIPLRYRFTHLSFSDESLQFRKQSVGTALVMVKSSPLFGVGLNNYLSNLPYFQKEPSLSFYLQPVHNIFLLVASETGIVGFAFFLLFISKTFVRIKQKNKFSIFNFQFSIFFIVLILGLFDHYFLTLQQGQLLFSFILGLCWSYQRKS